MSLPIRWTPEAEESFAVIIEHLEEKWTEKEVKKFVRTVNKVLGQISEFPRMYEASPSNPSIRKGFVVKQCSLFYEIEDESIILLFFWDNRRKPRLN